jgi:hypothetical protein
VCDPNEAPAPVRLDHLRIEQTGLRHPSRPAQWAFGLAAPGLHPLTVMRDQRGEVLPKAVSQKQLGLRVNSANGLGSRLVRVGVVVAGTVLPLRQRQRGRRTRRMRRTPVTRETASRTHHQPIHSGGPWADHTGFGASLN